MRNNPKSSKEGKGSKKQNGEPNEREKERKRRKKVVKEGWWQRYTGIMWFTEGEARDTKVSQLHRPPAVQPGQAQAQAQKDKGDPACKLRGAIVEKGR